MRTMADVVAEYGPTCLCGKRGSVRVGESGLMRLCQHCGNTYSYRVSDGKLVPLALVTAEELDRERMR